MLINDRSRHKSWDIVLRFVCVLSCTVHSCEHARAIVTSAFNFYHVILPRSLLVCYGPWFLNSARALQHRPLASVYLSTLCLVNTLSPSLCAFVAWERAISLLRSHVQVLERTFAISSYKPPLRYQNPSAPRYLEGVPRCRPYWIFLLSSSTRFFTRFALPHTLLSIALTYNRYTTKTMKRS